MAVTRILSVPDAMVAGGDTELVVSTGSAVNAGDRIIVGVYCYGTVTITGVTDDQEGLSYDVVGPASASDANHRGWIVSAVAQSSSVYEITITFSGTAGYRVGPLETFRDDGGPAGGLFASDVTNDASGTTHTGGAMTADDDESLGWAWDVPYSFGPDVISAGGTGWTDGTWATYGGDNIGRTEYGQFGAGAVQAEFDLTGADNGFVVSVLFGPSGMERLPPDAIISSSVLDVSGGIGDVQDVSVYAPDANWFTNAGSDGTLRVSFPTPAENPQTGADQQSFLVRLRKNATGGGTPTFSAELRETSGGSALETLATDQALADLAGDGELFELTWNASNLGTADGSAVELLLTFTSNGGGPNARHVEVGAIVWNALIAASTTPGQVTEAGSLRAAIAGESTEAGSLNAALASESIEIGSVRTALASALTEAGSVRITLAGEAAEAASVNVETSGEVFEAASVRVALAGEVDEAASVRVALAGEVFETGSVNIEEGGFGAVASIRRRPFLEELFEDDRYLELIELEEFVYIVAGNFIASSVEAGSVRIALAGELTETGSIRAALSGGAFETGSVRVALSGESVEAGSIRAALAGEATEAGSVRVETAASTGEEFESCSVRVLIASEMAESGSTNIALTSEVFETVSIRTALHGEATEVGSLNAALSSATVETGSVRILTAATPSEVFETGSIVTALAGETFEAGSVRAALASEVAAGGSTRTALASATVETASARVRQTSVVTETGGMVAALNGETTEAGSLRAAMGGESFETGSVRIVGTIPTAEIFETGSIVVALRAEVAETGSMAAALGAETASVGSMMIANLTLDGPYEATWVTYRKAEWS